MKNASKFKIELQTLLLKRGENLSDLCNATGIARTYLTGAFSGKRKLSSKVWSKITQHLELTSDQLLKLQISENATSEILTFKNADCSDNQKLIIAILYHILSDLSFEDEIEILDILRKYY